MPLDVPVRNVLTNQGSALIAQALGNQTSICFVRAEIGESNQHATSTLDTIAALTGLVSPIPNAKISIIKQRVSNGNYVVTVEYENEGQTTEKYINEIGLYARLGTQNDNEAILFTYLSFGTHHDYVQDRASMIIHRVYDLPFAFDGTLTVEITVSPSKLLTWGDTLERPSMLPSGDRYEDKVPSVGSDGKLHFDITGSATRLGNNAAGDFLLKSTVSTGNTLWFNQSLRKTDSPTFKGLTVNGYIDGAKFR